MADHLTIPTIDFRALRPGTDRWAATRAQVMASLRDYRCVLAFYDGVPPELYSALFRTAAPDLFALPLATKRGNASETPYLGYIGQIPGMPYESLRVPDAPDLADVERFTALMWPDGNPSFRDTVWEFGKQMKKLEQMVERMVLESVGVGEDGIGARLGSAVQSLRLSEYGPPPPDQEGCKISLLAHYDGTTLTVVCQHEVEGLEIQASDGRWVSIPPSPDTFAVVSGELIRIIANGRLQPSLHRVRTPSGRGRLSAISGARPKEGTPVATPEEAVDDQHPLLFNPCDVDAYAKFKYSDDGKNLSDPLAAFCGVPAATTMAAEGN